MVVGGELTYTVTASNHGPDLAPGVVVDDGMPEGVTLTSSASSQGTCQESLRAVICDLGSLAAGASATVTITVVPPAAGTIVNTATVTADSVDDPNPVDNAATATTTVITSADLGLTMVDSPDPVGKNKTLTYTVAIGNAGPTAATGVVVRDSLPAAVTYLSATATQGTCATLVQKVTCSLGALAKGDTATVTIAVRPTVGGTVTNTADVGR